MSYIYENLRPGLFTDEGQRRFLKIRDKVESALQATGAFRLQELGIASWEDMTCIDRLVELDEIREISTPGCPGQHRTFTKSYQRDRL